MNYLSQCIRMHAEVYKLDPEIVAALILHESEAYQYAYRIEEKSPLYAKIMSRDRNQLSGYVPPPGKNPSLHDEKVARGTSFGYMQVLGETGRVLGFKERYLLGLCAVETNLHFGCMYLAKCARLALSFPEIERDRRMLLGYNGGADKTYPDKVLEIRKSGEARRFLQL